MYVYVANKFIPLLTITIYVLELMAPNFTAMKMLLIMLESKYIDS